MDTLLTIASLRDTRGYALEPLPSDTVERILQAGRIAGSARNRQQRRFVLLESRESQDRAAEGVTRPTNLKGSAIAVAIVIQGSTWDLFDAARAAQNMMLAAANEGVASCPNATGNAGLLADVLGVQDGEQVAVVLSFGYPARPRDIAGRSVQQWLEQADRAGLEELVSRI